MHTLDAYLKNMGYVQSNNDPCMSSDGKHTIGYVNDFVFAAKNPERVEHVKSALSQKFEVKDLGELHYFLAWCESYT